MDVSFSKRNVCHVTKKKVSQLFVLCILLGQVVQTFERGFPVNDYMDHNHEKHGESCLTYGKCKKHLFATITAQTINFPKSDDPYTSIYCEWTIKSRSPSLQIGIATVNQFLDYYQNKSFRIDVYDGPSPESNKLTYWYGRSDFHPHHFEALTSTGDVLFLNYTARGGPIDLHMDLIYYLCGGTTDSGLEIGSPIFDRNTTFEVPDLLECTWTLKKPAGISYGLVEFYSINVPNCWTLTVTSENGRLMSFVNTYNLLSNSTSEILNDADEFATARRKIIEGTKPNLSEANGWEINKTDHYDYNESYNAIQEIQICNSSVQGIMFNGSAVKLTFAMFFPEKKYKFSAAFQFWQIPTSAPKLRSDNAVRRWFINYGALVFCSVGIVVGCIIMYSQARRWSRKGKKRSFVNNNLRNNATTSRNTRTNLYLNSENGPLVSTYAQEKLVELREVELSLSEVDDEELEYVQEAFYSINSPGQTQKNLSRKGNWIERPLNDIYVNKTQVLTHKRASSDSEIFTDSFKKVSFNVC